MHLDDHIHNSYAQPKPLICVITIYYSIEQQQPEKREPKSREGSLKMEFTFCLKILRKHLPNNSRRLSILFLLVTKKKPKLNIATYHRRIN